eukprot:403334611
MESHILALLHQDTQHKYKNNVQYPKKAFPLNKAAKQGHLSASSANIDKSLTLNKVEREALLNNFNQNYKQVENFLMQGGQKSKQILQEDELVSVLSVLVLDYKYEKQTHKTQNFETFYENMKSIVADHTKCSQLFVLTLILKHRITHERFMKHFTQKLMSQDTSLFLFIFQTIHLILLLQTQPQQAEIARNLSAYIPKKSILITWIDTFTELIFLHQAFIPNMTPDDKQDKQRIALIDSSIQKLVQRINKLLEQDIKEQMIAQELCGNIECLIENNEMFKALLFKQEHGDGGIIREQISI